MLQWCQALQVGGPALGPGLGHGSAPVETHGGRQGLGLRLGLALLVALAAPRRCRRWAVAQPHCWVWSLAQMPRQVVHPLLTLQHWAPLLLLPTQRSACYCL